MTQEKIWLILADWGDISDCKGRIMPSTPEPIERQRRLEEAVAHEDWPVAIDGAFLVDMNSTDERARRAHAILDTFLDYSLAGKRFLHYLCSDSDVVAEAARRGAAVLGYNAQATDDQTLLVNDWALVAARGPYDAILLFDVLDHLMDEEPEALLRRLTGLLAGRGRLCVRCHPWTARHATHLFGRLNKAYLHLIFNDEDLALLGLQNQPTRRIIHPLASYAAWFKAAGLQVVDKYVAKQRVEVFFVEHYAQAIAAHWKLSPNPELAAGRQLPLEQLNIQYVDYVLSR